MEKEPRLSSSRQLFQELYSGSKSGTIIPFEHSNQSKYMFLQNAFAFFDYEKPAFLVITELTAILFLWVLTGYLLQKWLPRQ